MRTQRLASVLLIAACLSGLWPPPCRPAADRDRHETVILLHGLGRTKRSMKKLARHLEKIGYRVQNEGYPSTSAAIPLLTKAYIHPAVEKARASGARKIHFVTHSLGGILVRQYLQSHALPPGSRIVMLSPPNRGSALANTLKGFPPYRWLMGPAGQALGTDPLSAPNRLAPVAGDIGVIAGTKTVEPWFSIMIPGRDDGKVSVKNTHLSEMNDFLTVSRSHPFIMNATEVLAQVAFYLANGRFRHEAD